MMTDETLERRFTALWSAFSVHVTTIQSLESDVRVLKDLSNGHRESITTTQDTVSSLRERIMELERKERKMNPSNS